MGRILGAVILSVAVIALVSSATVAVEPNLAATPENGCHGIVDAYSHAADPALPALRAVAGKFGCDLSGVERVARPGRPDGSTTDEDNDQQKPDEDATEIHGNAGASGPEIQAKCAKIASTLAQAQARAHGKSADAIARQATHWGCPAS